MYFVNYSLEPYYQRNLKYILKRRINRNELISTLTIQLNLIWWSNWKNEKFNKSENQP